MRIALIQTIQNRLYNFIDPTDSFSFEEARNLQKDMINQNLKLIEQAIEKECDLIVTTEAFNFPGQPEKQQGTYEDLIPVNDSALLEKLSELARNGNTYLVAGLYHKELVSNDILAEQGDAHENNKWNLYNSAFIYGRNGELVDCYHKVHLAGSENDYLTGGTRFCTIDADFGRFGVAICWDMQFPETSREYAIQKADLIVCPTWGWEQIYGHARAYENGIYVAAAMAVPYWMPIKDLRNPSEVISPEGEVLARGSYETAGLVICDVNIKDCIDWREGRIGGRKPEHYHNLS